MPSTTTERTALVIPVPNCAINRHFHSEMLKMRYTAALCAGLLALLGASAAQADTIGGIYLSADYWQYDGTADVAQTGKKKSQFSFDQQQQPALAVSIEHPVPVLPNVRVRYVPLKGNDTQNVNVLEFGGLTFGQDVNLDIDLTSTDMILYYEVLDNVVSADIGIAAKLIQGEIVAKEKFSLKKHKISLDQPVPMIYASAGGKLPLTGFSVKAEVAGVSYQNNQLTDAQVEIKYDFIDNMAVDIGLKAGYRQLSATLEDVEDTDADIDFKGPYLGLEVNF